MSTAFDFEKAFDRNVGFVTAWELQRLRHKTIAIAGMGGVGGFHLLTLARLGVGGFRIADLDHFELGNFNRQVGATLSSIGRHKVDVMAEMARDINPELRVETFRSGVHQENIDDFLRGVDLYVDGLDFFVPEVRVMVFRRCAELGIPALTAAPAGMGTSYLLFTPQGMSFDDYFGFKGSTRDEKLVDFFVGLTPRSLYRSYLVDPSTVDMGARKGPSSPVGTQLCAAVIGAESVKVLLGRGALRPAPWCHLFDAYRGKWIRTRVRGGYRNPVQIVRRHIGYRVIRRQNEAREKITESTPQESPNAVTRPSHIAPKIRLATDLEGILDLARWAPSGDNSQPWRFEPIGESSLRVHVTDDAAHDVYDCAGRGTLVSAGMLLETMRIAASQYERGLTWSYQKAGPSQHILEVDLPRDRSIEKDALAPYVRVRSVDRRAYYTRPLTNGQRKALESALGEELSITWFQSTHERLRCARLNAETTALRLRVPEAAALHERMLDFDHDRSPTGVSSSSLGLDPIFHRVLRWAMHEPKRQERIIRTLGTGLPSLEFDWTPGIFCAAHYLVALRSEPTAADGPQALLRAGQSLMRLWLKATELGIAMQPSFAPLSFAFHAEHGTPFTESPAHRYAAKRILGGLRMLWPEQTTNTLVFGGRLGIPQARAPKGRSTRRPLCELLLSPTRTVGQSSSDVRIGA